MNRRELLLGSLGAPLALMSSWPRQSGAIDWSAGQPCELMLGPEDGEICGIEVHGTGFYDSEIAIREADLMVNPPICQWEGGYKLWNGREWV